MMAMCAASGAANPGCSRLSAGLLPSTKARSSPESHLKGVPRGDPRARLPAPRLLRLSLVPPPGQLGLLQYFVQRNLDPRQQIAVDRLGLPCGGEPRATIYPGVPQFRIDHPHLARPETRRV